MAELGVRIGAESGPAARAADLTSDQRCGELSRAPARPARSADAPPITMPGPMPQAQRFRAFPARSPPAAWRRPGKAAKSSPSITNTRPMRHDEIGHRSTASRDRAVARGCFGAAADGAPGAGVGADAAVRAACPTGSTKIAEELRIGLQQHAGVVRPQAGLVGLHRAVEREEVRIACRRRRRRCGCARRRPRRGSVSAVAVRVGEQHGHVAVGAWRGFPARAGCPGRGTRPPRAGARSACAGRPPGCSAPAGRRGGCARRPPSMPKACASRVELLAHRAPSAARARRARRAVSVASPSTRRSAELSRIESCEFAPSIEPTVW